MRHWISSIVIGLACGSLGGCGSDGRDGMDGEPGDPAVPSISAVIPGQGFTDRQMRVTISGNETGWTGDSVVGFGDGITVDQVVVASPTALLVDITIGEAASRGAHDVVVDTNGASISFIGGFAIREPLGLEESVGQAVQGSIVLAHLRQFDISTPFDSTGAPDYPYLQVDAAPEGSAVVVDAAAYAMDVHLMVDVFATGPLDVRAVSDDGAQGTTSLASDALEIAERQPVALAADVFNDGTMASPFESHLYQFTPAAHQLLAIVSSLDAGVETTFALLPPSGSFADRISYRTFPSGLVGYYVTETTDPVYVVVWDGTGAGASGYDFSLRVFSNDSDDLEPNDTCDTAQAVASTAALTNLTLRDAADEDWFAITAVAGDVGESVHVATWAGDADADTYVEVFRGSCASLDLLGASTDYFAHENHLSGLIPAAGPVYVRVRPSPNRPFAGSLYDLELDIVPRSDDEPSNDTCEGATPSTLGTIEPLFMMDELDQDWFSFTAGPGDVSLSVHVTTSPGDAFTDTVVEVFEGTDCDNLTSLGGPSADDDYHEDYYSDPLGEEGTYWVKVSHTEQYPFSESEYRLTVALE